jgi:hypothetical protein
LPHIFFKDVSRFAVHVSESGDASLRERLSIAIERLAASDNPIVVDVIRASFVESLIWGDESQVRALADLRRTFGPETLQRIAEFEDWAANFARSNAKQRDRA